MSETKLAGVTLNTLLDAIHAAGKQAEVLSDVYVEIGRTAAVVKKMERVLGRLEDDLLDEIAVLRREGGK
jgi:hypothetical protein